MLSNGGLTHSEGVDLNLQLETPPLEQVELLWPGLTSDLDRRGGLVEQVDRRVGQPALSEVLLGQLGSEN